MQCVNYLNEVPDECMVCYEHFPVSLQFFCGHELCSLCAESVMTVCESKNCPKCRAPLLNRLSELLPIIYIYLSQLTTDTPIEKLQRAFPLICSVPNLTTLEKCINMGIDVNTKDTNLVRANLKFLILTSSQKHILPYKLLNQQ